MTDFDHEQRDRILDKLKYVIECSETLQTSMRHIPDRDVDAGELEKLMDGITDQLNKFMEESFGPGEGSA